MRGCRDKESLSGKAVMVYNHKHICYAQRHDIIILTDLSVYILHESQKKKEVKPGSDKSGRSCMSPLFRGPP